MTLPASARKVLVMELAGLGDNVHLLPALWLVRRRWPDARLHVMVNAHVASLFRLAPWIDRVWPYPSAPKPGLRANLRWARELREERYDCVVNTTGSDRSSMLSWATRSPVRLGRRPADGGPIGWRHLFTDVMEHPHYLEPMYLQKWHCVREAGFGSAADAPEFHVSIDPAWRRAAGIEAADEHRYIHVSPFTTANERELPAAQVADVVARMRAARPDLRVVLSCAANAREQAKMEALLPLLGERPWRVHAGTLDIAALAAVMQTSALNLSGDTGSLHLAMMCGVPAVAWFRDHKGVKEWIPAGRQYRVLVSEGGKRDALHGIDTDALVRAAAEVLESPVARAH
jgi:ADP-heptose:LPS heptosyltransferase